MAESFNATLKRLQGWKEVPVDSIVLTLYNLQCYHFNEIQRGFSGKQVKKFKTFTFNLSACRLRQL